MRRHLRTLNLYIRFAFVFAVGCSGDLDQQSVREAGDAAVAPAAELEGLLSAAIASYDRQVIAGCPCSVEFESYVSIDECLMWQQSGPDWVSCATAALEEFDSPELRRTLRCVEAMADANADCLAPKSCDDETRSECWQSPLQCFSDNGAVVVELDIACPDFSLLPRQTAAGADGGTR